MKKKVLGIVLASALVLSLGLVFAGPVMASPTWQHVGTAYGGPWVNRLGPCFDVEKDYDGSTAYLRVEPFTYTDSGTGFSYDGSLETCNFYIDADNDDGASNGDFMIEYWHYSNTAAYHYHDGTSWHYGTPVSIPSLSLPAGMAVNWDDASYPAYVELQIPDTMIGSDGEIGVVIFTAGNGFVPTQFSTSPGLGYCDLSDYDNYVDMFFVQVEDLCAGQYTDVGEVKVWNDCTTLYVKYETSGGWEMTETHLHIGTSQGDIPQTKKGNPIPGHFMAGDYYDPPETEDLFEFDLSDEEWPPCTDLYIAAHAIVVRETTTELVQNGSFEYPEINNPPYNWDAIPDGDAGLVWSVSWYICTPPVSPFLEIHEDKFVTADDGDQYVELDTAYGSPPRTATPEPASVEISQSITACPSGLYTLRYAWAPRPNHSDNQLEVLWNSTSIATHSAGDPGSTTSWTGEEHAYLAGPSSGPFTLAFRETGTADGKGMFLDSVSLVCFEEETAWGDGCDGTDFPGKNWATYFTYHVRGVTGVVGDGWSDVAGAYGWEARARHGGAGGWRAFVDDVFPPVNPLWTGGTVPWLNGGQMWFELIYDDSTNSATFTIHDSSDDSVLGTVTDSSVPGFTGLIGIQGKTSPEAAGSVVVDNVEVNGIPVCGDDGFTAQGTDFVRDLKYLDIYAVPSGSFTLTGDLIFTWGAHPSNEGPALSIYVQDIP